MEELANQLLTLLAEGINGLAELIDQSPLMILCATPLLIILLIRLIFGKQIFKLILRLLFAAVLGLAAYIFLIEESPLATTLGFLVAAVYFLLAEKRSPIVLKLFSGDGFLSISNIWGLILGVSLGIVSLFVLNWIGWRLPDGFLSEIFISFGAFLIPIVSFGVGYVAGSKYSLLSARKHHKSLILMSSLVAATTIFAAWYYFDYREFRTRAIAVLAEDAKDPEAALDAYLMAETGSSSAGGYFVWSATNGATISVFDEDVEIAEGALSSLINWGKRLLVFVVSILLVRRGFYTALVERVQSGKLTGEGFWSFLDAYTDED